jgi:hypothetical protein
MFWLIGGVMAAVVTVMFLRGTPSTNRLSSLGPILQAPLHRNTAIFFGPALVRDNVLELPLLTNEQTFYSLTVVGSAALVAPLFANTQTFYAPQVNQNVTAPLLTNTQAFYAPAVVAGTALVASLHTNSQTFHAPTLHLNLALPLLTNTQLFPAIWVSLGSSPGYQLTSPTVSPTHAAGDPPEIDLGINADHYAGFYLDIQRSTTGTKNVSDGSYVSPTLNISHQITPSEVAALAITNADLSADGYVDPSGVYFQQYRIRREDGALSQWVEISGTVTASVAVLYDSTGFNKKSYLSVTGTPRLSVVGNASVGAPQCVRATIAVTGQKQFEVTVNTLPSNSFIIGLENGTTDLNSGTPAPGISNALGAAIRLSATGYSLWRAGSATSSGSTNAAVGDVISVKFDTSAGTMSFYRTRSAATVLIGTITGISLSAWNAYVGTYTNTSLTANFGAAAFSRALDSGYSIYG